MSNVKLLYPNARMMNDVARRVRITDHITGVQTAWHPNAEQQKLFQHWDNSRRLFVLKPRQIGVTTAECVRDLLFTTINDANKNRVNTWLVWDDEDVSVQKVEWIHSVARTLGITCRKVYNYLQFPNGSTIRGYSSKSRDGRVGTGETCQRLHASELPFWRNADAVWNSLKPALPPVDDVGEVVIETTMSPGQSLPQNLWRQQNAFAKVFFDVQMHAEYKTKNLDPPVTSEELKTFKDEGFTDDDTIRYMVNMYRANGNNLRKLLREYPQLEKHMFELDEMRWIRRDPTVMDHTSVHVRTERGNMYVVKIHKPASMFDTSDAKKRLVLGVDIAGGTGKAASAFVLFDKENREIVASFHDNRIPTDEYADVVHHIALMYKCAVVVEANTIGLAVIHPLEKRGLFVEVRTTTSQSQYQGLVLVQKYLEQPSTSVPLELLVECQQLSVKDGTFVGPKDLCMALSFALLHDEEMPYKAAKRPAYRQEGCVGLPPKRMHAFPRVL